MKLQIAAAAAAVLCAASAPVQAKATASAELTGLVISIDPISTAAGAAAPSVRFTTGSDYLEINALTQDPSSYQYAIATTPGFFSMSSLATTPAYAGARAVVSGDPFSASGGTLGASSFAYGTAGQISTASSHVVAGDDSAYAGFTLGPNTRLDVTAFYDVSATVGGAAFPSFGGAWEMASFGAALSLLPASGQPGQGSFQGVGGGVAHAGFHVDAPYLEQGELHVWFAGSETDSTSGLFMASVAASTVSSVPIPEPGNGALLIAGLAMLGWLRRRSDAASRPGVVPRR